MPILTSIALEQPLQVIGRDGPWLESHNLIQLTESRQARLNLGQTLGDPGQITPFQHKLLLQNVEQVVTLVATDSHDSQIELMLQAHDIRVSFCTFSDNFARSVRVILDVLGKPAKNALMRPDPSILVE